MDIARGDLIAAADDAPGITDTFTATVTQLADKGVRAGLRAQLRYGSQFVPVIVTSVDYLIDIDTLESTAAPEALALNDIAQVTLRLARPLPIEEFRPRGAVGALLLVDNADGTSLAAGMVGDRRAALHRRAFRPGAVQKDGSVTSAEPRCPAPASTSASSNPASIGTASAPRAAAVPSDNFPTPGP